MASITCPFLARAGGAMASAAGQTALCALAAKCPHVASTGVNPAAVLAKLTNPAAPVCASGAAAAGTPAAEQLANPCCGERRSGPHGGPFPDAQARARGRPLMAVARPARHAAPYAAAGCNMSNRPTRPITEEARAVASEWRSGRSSGTVAHHSRPWGTHFEAGARSRRARAHRRRIHAACNLHTMRHAR